MSLNQGVILPWNKNNQFYIELTKEVARHCSINPNHKWEELTEEKKRKVIFGDNKMINIFNNYTGWSYSREFDGEVGFLENKLCAVRYVAKEELNKYLSKFRCEVCGGTRLKKEALAVKINNKTYEITKLSIEKLLKWFIDL
ncbi:MAG: hypothetical protein CM15mP40_11950 [Alphaproteobacteria bacterium]|nr:MAG: hypothetical protein CM15mP40_11950 [Alphaproteobacteria bacterium]